jgi:putative SOS response-associated peptidase YedK
MPVILAPHAESAWLQASQPPERLYELLGGLSASDTALRPVGPAVNDARYDGPECLASGLDELQTALF